MSSGSALIISEPSCDSHGRAILILDAQHWKSADDFYSSFFNAVRAPPWHGRNLDALNDSVCNGAINGIDGPYTVVIINYGAMDGNARAIADRFIAFFREDLGTPVRVVDSDDSEVQRGRGEEEDTESDAIIY